MSKVAFLTIVLNGEPFLEPCLKSILPYGECFVVEGSVGYWRERGITTSTDNTNVVLGQLLDKSHVIHGTWDEKDSMLEAATSLIPNDCSHIFAVDSDEIWKPEDLERIIGILDDWDSCAFKPYSFYGGFSRYMVGYEEQSPPWGWQRVQRWYPHARFKTHRPPTVLAPDGRPWREHRHLSHEDTDKMGIRFYHYSYCLPKQTADKIDYYHYRNPSGTIENYMQRVYLPWVRGNDTVKGSIEREFWGVHNEKPESRTDCFTLPFTGQHPKVIQDIAPQLTTRFIRELEMYR